MENQEQINLYIKLNPIYFLKPDNGRVIILIKKFGRILDLPSSVNESVETYIHPLYAKIFQYLNGKNIEESSKQISNDLKLNQSKVISFIKRILNKNKYISVKSKSGSSLFPPYILISSTKEFIEEKLQYSPDVFNTKNIDLTSIRRHHTPTVITLMLNTKCHTNCIYCYADRRHITDCKIPFSRIKELIKEAKSLYVRNFDIIGGEFFLYEDWYLLIKELRSNDFYPYLSTKVPINEDTVRKLKDTGIEDIQISLDTLHKEHLSSILHVSQDYVEKIKRTIFLLDKYNIKIFINTILTAKNDSIEDIKSIYDFLKKNTNVNVWRISMANKSMYIKGDYSKIKPDKNNVIQIQKYLSQLPNNENFKIIYSKLENSIINKAGANKKESFINRSVCSGGYSSLFILPDGKVTICEQLYWTPQMITGDINTQSISEIWNSERLLKLLYIKKEDIPSDSLCSKCNEFEECRSIKQVCYRDIIKYFGGEKWYYPDINCPKFNGSELFKKNLITKYDPL